MFRAKMYLFRHLLILLFFASLISISSCNKEDYFEFGNQINLISPFQNFEEENPDFLPFNAVHFDNYGNVIQAQCEFLLVGNDDTEYNLAYFNTGKSYFDKTVITPVDWKDYRGVINPGSKITFRARVNYLTQEAFTREYNEILGEYVTSLVSDYLNYWKTLDIDMEAKLNPNRIYEMDMLDKTLEDLGVYIDNSQECYVGTWYQKISDCDDPDAFKVFNFSSNGKGYAKNVIMEGYGASCIVTCRVTFNYSWVDNGDGTLTLTYSSIDNDCNQNPPLPGSSVINISCNGNSINIAGQSYSRR